jgi:hypothetical protein
MTTNKLLNDPFIKFPREWERRLQRAKHVSTYRLALYVLYRNWRYPAFDIVASNVGLEPWGISRWEKSVALKELEDLGLITVRRNGNRAPTVEVIEFRVSARTAASCGADLQ